MRGADSATRWRRLAANALIAVLASLAMTIAPPATAHAAAHASSLPDGSWQAPTPHAVIGDRLHRNAVATQPHPDDDAGATVDGIELPRDSGLHRDVATSAPAGHRGSRTASAPRAPPAA